MRLIDTHSHIYSEEFSADRDEVISRALTAGVEHIFMPNVDSTSIAAMLETRNKWPELCHVMMGVHPTSVNANYRDELAVFDKNIDDNFYVAVGEIGIDLYWDKTYLNQQRTVFEHQIDVAIQKSLPIVIHCRDSFAEVIASLRKFDKSKLRGIFHSFSGVKDQAREIFLSGDFYLGIGGVCTYKNAKFSERLFEIPIDRIVLETDAPYLTPVPFRGKRNEQAYLVYVAKKLASVYKIEEYELAEQTSKNAENLFLM